MNYDMISSLVNKGRMAALINSSGTGIIYTESVDTKDVVKMGIFGRLLDITTGVPVEYDAVNYDAIAFKVQESADNVNFTDVAAAEVTFKQQGDTGLTVGSSSVKIGVVGTKRYVRIKTTCTNLVTIADDLLVFEASAIVQPNVYPAT